MMIPSRVYTESSSFDHICTRHKLSVEMAALLLISTLLAVLLPEGAGDVAAADDAAAAVDAADDVDGPDAPGDSVTLSSFSSGGEVGLLVAVVDMMVSFLFFFL